MPRPTSADVDQLLTRPVMVGAPPHVDPLTLPVLLLNRIFQPVRITCARRAIKLIYTDAARLLDSEGELIEFGAWLLLPVRAKVDDKIDYVGGSLRVPRVVHLRRYAKMHRPQVRLTSRNVMLRDGFQCQYCRRKGPAIELDIDHVLPRSRGGQDSWTNLVTACQPCNRRKGRRTPLEAKMPLMRKPCAPNWSNVVQLLAGTTCRYPEWEPFLLKAG